MLCDMCDPLHSMDVGGEYKRDKGGMGCFPRETALKWAKTAIGEGLDDAATFRRAAALMILYAEEK